MLKLWGRTNSINVMKPLWCLGELGLDYERIDAGMKFGVVGEAHYGRLNPNRRVPTLEDGDLVLWESNVIVRYLASRYGMGTLCPEDPAVRAIADQWMDWQQTTLGADLTYVFWAKIRNSPDHADPAKQAAGIKKLGELWGMVDAALEGRDFVAGNTLTMGDIPIGCAMWRWSNMPIERPSLPRLEAWHSRLKERAPFMQHVAQPLT